MAIPLKTVANKYFIVLCLNLLVIRREPKNAPKRAMTVKARNQGASITICPKVA